MRAGNEFKKRSGFTGAKIVMTAYANRIGNFGSKDEVERTMASLRNAGHSPYGIEDPQEGYRVFIGAYIAKSFDS
jgi:hypothetical protein